jgi:isopentenyl diphosphate isomerase/L-lactate dehydrogenase-like FMN-dependent dehydrogenase
VIVKVFVSHFSGDEWVAGQMCKEIGALGAEAFIDAVDIEKGDDFEDEIREALDACDELVVLLTPQAMERPYVWMEVGAAWVQKKRIVGVLYGLTAAEISTRERTPALLKGIDLCDLNGEFGTYLDELRGRIRPSP